MAAQYFELVLLLLPLIAELSARVVDPSPIVSQVLGKTVLGQAKGGGRRGRAEWEGGSDRDGAERSGELVGRRRGAAGGGELG